jgi:hypothetical protein
MPTNIAWLTEPDPAMQYMGWAFYRHEPWAGLAPIGVNARYGMELGSSILYADAIPLLAIVFRPLSSLLPEPFQYFGLWLLVSFLLQSYFAWKLLGLTLTGQANGNQSGLAVRLLGAGLFVFAPPLLFRLSTGHYALVGQWTLLAALLLNLGRPRRPVAAWSALILTTALIHTYLLAMVCFLWGSSWVSRSILANRRWTIAALEIVWIACLVAGALWEGGFFLVGSGRDMPGFGVYHMNLLAPINPAGWSRVLPTLPGHDGDYEGFNFLGLGGIALAILAVPAVTWLLARRMLSLRREWIPLGATLTVLSLYALSNTIGFGSFTYTYALPDGVISGLSTLRASGRLFWPAFYTLLLAAIAVIAKACGRRVTTAVLAVLLVVQIVDMTPGWWPVREKLTVPPERSWKSPLVASFWAEAGAEYSTLRRYPPRIRPGWEIWADYAQRHRMRTDVVYLARYDRDRRAALDERESAALLAGTFDRDTLYILDENMWSRLGSIIDPRADLLAKIDGFFVLAPGWNARTRRPGAGTSFTPGAPPPGLASRGPQRPAPRLLRGARAPRRASRGPQRPAPLDGT